MRDVPSLPPVDGHGLSRRDLLRAIGAATAVGSIPAPAWASSHQRVAARVPSLDPYDRRIVGHVQASRALEHLHVLSEQIGPRISGTPSEHAAAEYLAGVLDGYGYAVTLQPFAVADRYLSDTSSSSVDLGDDISWQGGASPQGALDVTVTGELVDAGAGLTPEEYPDDVTGKVVLADYQASTAQRTLQVRTAVELGAAAVLLVRVGTDPLRRLGPVAAPSLSEPVQVPVISAGQVHGERLREHLAAGPLAVTVRTEHHSDLTSYNVIGERDAGGSAPVVMITAHYDSVVGARGANDDGSGTTLCLEVARVLARYPTRATLRFALWGSEEFGLIGSRFYAGQLSPEEVAGIAGVFQNDMVGTSWDGPDIYYQLLTVDGQDNTTSRAVAEAGQRLGYAPAMIGPVARGSSDHVPFHELGIPAGNYSWRQLGTPPVLEPIYHTPEDTIAYNISPTRLQASLELVGSAAYHVAMAR